MTLTTPLTDREPGKEPTTGPPLATTMSLALAVMGVTLVAKTVQSAQAGTLAGPELVLPVIGVTALLLARVGRGGGRRATIGVLAFSVVVLLGNLRHVLRTLRLPESPLDFIPNFVVVGCLATVIVAAVLLLRGRTGSLSGQGRVRLMILVVLAAGSLASIVAMLLGGGTTPSTGAAPDIETTGNAYVPATMTVDAGDVLTFRNADAYAHTFTVPDLGVDVHLPGNATGEVAIPDDAAPTTYQVICLLHPGLMDATLTVANA